MSSKPLVWPRGRPLESTGDGSTPPDFGQDFGRILTGDNFKICPLAGRRPAGEPTELTGFPEAVWTPNIWF